MYYIVQEDVLSVYKKKNKPVVYAVKGETVKFISRSDEVMIAERKNGERFPVLACKLLATNKTGF
jgi:hypothetical protein